MLSNSHIAEKSAPHRHSTLNSLKHAFASMSPWHHRSKFGARKGRQAWPKYEKKSTSSSSPLHALNEDSSAKFWSIYISEAERYDSALMESWKADMEGMLIFSGLFSASLTAFIIESYRNLVPDPGSTAVELLTRISNQLSAQANGSQFSPSPSPPFEVPLSSLVCNGLWFVSLGLSLICALLSTFVEQWARDFLHKTERVHSPIRRARVFSFLFYGLTRFEMHTIVDIIPLLLQLSLLLFFAGLAAFLLPINNIMTGIVVSILAIFAACYTLITVLPLIFLECPYRTPLSKFLWRFVHYLTEPLGVVPSSPHDLNDGVLAAAMQRRSTRDERAVLWTLETLTDNNELLPFVEATHDIIETAPIGSRDENDHLFRLVLQTADPHASLSHRILSLLWSAETLPLSDPLRERRQLAGLRGLWALGLVAARSTRGPVHEIYGIGRTTLNALSSPPAYRLSLDAVVPYAHLKSIQSRFEDIAIMFSSRDMTSVKERRRAISSLQGMISTLENDCKRARIAHELAPVLDSFTRLIHSNITSEAGSPDPWHSTDFEHVDRILQELQSGRTISWPFHLAKIVVHLVGTAFRDGVVPYKILRTCKEILPHISAVPPHLIPLLQSSVPFPRGPKDIGPALHAQLTSFSHIDTIHDLMRCTLRLLPLLDPKSVVPIIHWYLTNQPPDDPEKWRYAGRDCDFAVLWRMIMASIDGDGDENEQQLADHTQLCGIVKLWLSGDLKCGEADCRKLLALVERTEAFGLAMSSLPTIKAMFTAQLLALDKSLVDSAPPDDTLPLVSLSPRLMLDSDSDPYRGKTKLPSTLSDRYASLFIEFLEACASPDTTPYEAPATIRYLRNQWRPLLASDRCMSLSVQAKFAQAVTGVVNRASDSTSFNSMQNLTSSAVLLALQDGLDPDGKLVEQFTDLESMAAIHQAVHRISEDLLLASTPGEVSGMGTRMHRGFSVASEGVSA
ncbi:hypothetical protein R3P38DRAFT_2716441 [Favolaschia claudopus]|uniref:DUF6535 domain-containing protein n=1 Tax=Favolaschia claudopus TaxID=2862362 RepID=A0AAW0AW58_9AGAR